jgi:hypothetical protein
MRGFTDILERGQACNWVKKGLLFEPNIPEYSHASHPCAIRYKDDIFILAFTARDAKQRSHVFLVKASVSHGSISLITKPIMALPPGQPGFFDCDGAIAASFVVHKDLIHLYYVGWQNLPEGLWICDTGRATLDPEALTLSRDFPGPVLGRDKNNPLFAAGTAFYIEGGIWHAWYNSGLSWRYRETGWHHVYGVHHALSNDGINWQTDLGQCIKFADEREYAFGRPTVCRWGDKFVMWYAHRATEKAETYRIGVAVSDDGGRWERYDSQVGIDVSPEGWDSEMICYPSVFEHKNQAYMLYNGNGYGKSGFGFAVLEAE